MSAQAAPRSFEQTRDPAPGTGWQRLSARIIWVDLVISVLSSLPAVIAIWAFDLDDGASQIWPLLGLAAFGVVGALLDLVRWIVTRFRITDSHVELRTGLLVRQRRTIQRDRIRTVDVTAKLRHRVTRLRVVTIGAGQQTAAGEAALPLDALSVEDASALQRVLLRESAPNARRTESGRTEVAGTDPVRSTGAEGGRDQAGSGGPQPHDHADEPGTADPTDEPIQVFARFEPTWVIYNMFNIWAFVLAIGLLWGALWLLSAVGIDLVGFALGLLDWTAIGWIGTALIAVVVVGALGAIGLGVSYFIENWNLELARVRSSEGTLLRTRKGLFTTREINRDENRIRGAQISEPVLWRWMGVSDTSVITTGLDAWSASEPTAILPRGPVRRARRVAGQVLGDSANPFHADLERHPRTALHRRLRWATATCLGIGGVLTVLSITDVVPSWTIWAAIAFLPVSLVAAVLAYRALGHTITDRYVITRSGLLNRSTTVLQRSAVSTIVIRESVLQRWLGLRSVSTMTAAGDSGYDTPDIGRADSLDFAVRAAPGILDPFLVPRAEGGPGQAP